MHLSDIARSPWSGALFGCVLFPFALVTAGVGHGSYLPFMIYGAPLSIVPLLGLFVAPFWWGAVGWMLRKRRRNPAINMLAIHSFGAALFLGFDGFRVPDSDQGLFWAGMAIYFIGLAAAWWAALTTVEDE
jgi:hypothetical protein